MPQKSTGTTSAPVADTDAAPISSALLPIQDYNSSGDDSHITTEVGKKAEALHGDTDRLQASVLVHERQIGELRAAREQIAANYFGRTGQISSRLQVGTPPGNPQVVAQWNAALADLDALGGNVSRMTQLSNDLAADHARAVYLIDTIHATLAMRGAVDEDHNLLHALDDTLNGMALGIERSHKSLVSDNTRENSVVAYERNRMVVLAKAVDEGRAIDPIAPPYSEGPVAALAPLPLMPVPVADSAPPVHRRPVLHPRLRMHKVVKKVEAPANPPAPPVAAASGAELPAPTALAPAAEAPPAMSPAPTRMAPMQAAPAPITGDSGADPNAAPPK